MKPNLPCISILLILVAFYMCNFSHAGNQQAPAHKETSQLNLVKGKGSGTTWPNIVVTPEYFFQEMDPNIIETQTMHIANIGSVPLDFSIDISYPLKSVKRSNQGSPWFNWLSAAPLTGTVPAGGTLDVVVTFNADGLDPGTYEGLLSISSNDPDHPVVEVPATIFLPSWALWFLEDWSSGSFYSGEWSFDPGQANWSVTSTYGNPLPSAMFGWTPELTNYSYSLITPTLNALWITDNVTVKFDIELSNYSTSTLEGLAVEVFDGTAWHLVHDYTNVGGSFPFANESFNITSIVAGHIFNVRFRAHGENSFNINYWYLDNIRINQQVIGNLSGTITRLSDSSPVEGAIVTIDNNTGGTYSDTTNVDGVYSFPDVVYGDYDLTAVKPGYNTFVSAGPVVITGGLTSVYEIAMTIPEMVIDPPEINEFVLFGTIFTQPVTITNAGDGTLNWSAGVTILNKQNVAVPASDGNFPRGDAPVSIGRAPMAKSSVPWSQQEAKGTTAYAFNVNHNQTFISFNTDDPGNQNVITTIDYLPCGGTFDMMNSDFMYVIDYNYNTLIKVGIAAGEVTNIGYCQPYGGQNWSGITVDKHTNIMYGISTNTSESCLYYIDKETGETTLIGPTGIPGAIDLTIDGTGQMYSFDIVTDAAYRIDKETGASTLIGSLGYDANFVQGMGWDPEDDLIYITGYNNATQAGELRILDRETGNTAMVGDLGGEIDALAFPGGGFTWLSIDQHSGSLPAGASDTMMVSLDATFIPPSDVAHHGTITFSSDPNVGAVAVPVTMSTEDWYGSLEGYVTHGGSGVPDAVVSVFRGGINWFTVNTDPNGYYLIGNLLPFNYIVTVEAAGYNPYYIANVFISPGDTTILNVALTAPVVNITPPELNVSLHAGESAIRMLTIANTGDGPVTIDGSVHINNTKVISIPHGNGEFPHGTAAPSIERAPESKPVGNHASEIRRGITGYAFNIYPDHTFFSFDSDDPGTVNIISTIDYVPAGATFDATNTGFIYFLDYYTRFLRKVDVATGNVTDIGLANPYGDQYWTGITVDKSTNILYGISTDYSESYIYTIDAETGNATVIGPTGIPCAIDVAVDGSGQMYSFDIAGDNAYAIEKETGISTLIGSLGFDANYAQGMAWEPLTDIIYLAAFNNATLNGELRILDRGTGNTTLVGGMGGEVDGLTFAGGVPAEWLYTVTDPFSVPAGSSVEVPVYFYATDLEPGTYTGDLTFHSDPNAGTIVIPVWLIVEPGPVLSIAQMHYIPSGPVSVPVHAEEIVNMGSFQFTIDYDESKLVYTGTSNWYPGVTDVLVGNPSAGKLTFVWAASTTGITMSDGNFFNIDFIYNGSLNGAPIAWSDNPTQREFADWDGNIFVPTYYNGLVIGDPIGLSENRSPVFRIYPNPASNIVTVKSDFSFSRIEVFSSLGQTVYKACYPGEKEVQLNVSALPAGIYMVKVYTEKGVGMVKVAVGR